MFCEFHLNSKNKKSKLNLLVANLMLMGCHFFQALSEDRAGKNTYVRQKNRHEQDGERIKTVKPTDKRVNALTKELTR